MGRGLSPAPKQSVRGLIITVLVAGVGYIFLHQKQNEKAAAPAQTVTTSSTALTPAPRGQASEYDYMKRSLDKARDVRDISRARTQADQDPH